ncbi:Sec23-binding domain of Sec16-domain-containing protein, partial [Polychytrium aggregatum]|uniref:Sec23-binding domain of Sec16-domain-containing protein n=1 Tax=Polychytrium aggregatum TaxID=110093 RepID=UPI0022FF1060
ALAAWKETVAMILSNRTAGDLHVISAFGDLLKMHGCSMAAHICYFMTPGQSLLSGWDQPGAKLTLVGADSSAAVHRHIEAIQATEILEHIHITNGAICLPHFQAYKLVYASLLADLGYVDEALSYFESI